MKSHLHDSFTPDRNNHGYTKRGIPLKQRHRRRKIKLESAFVRINYLIESVLHKQIQSGGSRPGERLNLAEVITNLTCRRKTKRQHCAGMHDSRQKISENKLNSWDLRGIVFHRLHFLSPFFSRSKAKSICTMKQICSLQLWSCCWGKASERAAFERDSN